ncbi:MAG: restriction endonuclease subunit S [Candidatus Brocadia sp.]|nr:restriction endonuclease subunit S [Candidatus Brocadia sp.]UJS17593.1 MAG: restriction endonuclease subunit S [Candidatus Jettenia sp.]
MVEAMKILKGYKKTEVGIIPNDWEVNILGNLIEKFVNGGTPSTQVTEYWNGNIPWITGADILNQKVAVIRRYISKEAVKNSSTNIIEKGNLLFVSRTGVGKLAIAPFDIAISQDFTGIYVKQSELSTQGITRDTLSSFQIPLPPTKSEQTTIATALNDADALITQLEKLIAKKRNIKRGAMQELLRPKEGWEAKKLGEIPLSVASGKSNTQSKEGKYPIYGSTGIIGWRNVYDYEGNKILIARVGANAGTVNKVSGKYCVSDNTLIVSLQSNIDIDFIFFKLINYHLNRLVFGSGQPLITGGQLKNLEFSLPSKEEQTRIAQILSDMDAEIEALEKKLEKYKMIKQGMMQNLLTGKIRLV